MLLSSVDLRSNINEVYNQSTTAACFPHAVVNALDCMYDNKGQSKRFSRSFIWYWGRFHSGMINQNRGVSVDAMITTINTRGVTLESECPWTQTVAFPEKGELGYSLVRSSLNEGLVDGIKRLLCIGVPVIWLMKVTPMFNALAFYKNWKTMPDLPPDVSQVIGEHAVCIVGYDDSCGRFLVENSYGKDWGDGGFFGLPYGSIRNLTEGWCHIDLAPIVPKSVQGYEMQVPSLSSVEQVAFTQRVKSRLTQELMKAYESNSEQGLINACIEWGVSDKMLEHLANFPRMTVRNLKETNSNLIWDGFIWDQI